MQTSRLNYSLVPRQKIPRQKNKCLEVTTFSFPSLKKKTHLHLNGYFNPTTKISKNHFCCQVMTIDAPTYEHVENVDNLEGLGIVSFLTGKHFLITGATGFLAKVLIEKILRTNPDVGKIYVIIKAKDEAAAKDRLIKERFKKYKIWSTVRIQNEDHVGQLGSVNLMISDGEKDMMLKGPWHLDKELFESLQKIHGKKYRDFMLKKLVPVLGNIRETSIGIKSEIAEVIANEVDIIVNSAATTNFDERYDVALDINTLGPYRLMSFAKRTKKFKLLLQLSTAYVNGQRQGVVSERPFCLGDTISSGIRSLQDCQALDIEAEIKLAFSSGTKDDALNTQEMKDLGKRRAQLYGWTDTYVFTKAMGEMVINSMRGEIPVVTIGPSVVESTLKDPIPGWIEGNRMMDPVVTYYGKGQLKGFHADNFGVLDVIPADMVVSATIAAMAKHGSRTDPGIHVYQVASSNVNPLGLPELMDMMFKHFSASPFVNSAGQPIQVHEPLKLFHEKSEFLDFILTDAMEKSAEAGSVSNERVLDRLKALYMKMVEQAKYLATIYEPYTFYGGRFDNANTDNLIDEMSEEERKNFQFDVETINWNDYLVNVHIPGLRKYVMKGRGMEESN